MKRLLVVLLVLLAAAAHAGTGVHTTYLWHMHQPIYWPDASTWNPDRYETAHETITLGHSQNDVWNIFDKDDRVGDYQHYPRDAVSSISDLPEAGAQVSFAGALMENLFSLGDAGWNGGRYASNWYQSYRDARGWLNTAGQPRLEPVLVGFHHAIGPLLPDAALRMELALAVEIYGDAWGPGAVSRGFFPAEMCFSERMIPALVDAGVDWAIVGDTHLARACVDYPYQAHLDNCDPPNRADQTNPVQGVWRSQTISRGVTVSTPLPFGFTPHRAQWIDPDSGAVSEIVVVPASNAMGWDEGYGLYGTGDIDAIAPHNDPSRPMLALFAHDGDNAWAGGNSYYYENVTGFSHAAAAAGYTPTTIATYLQHHPVPAGDVVHVEDGGWVNADGDFGSPQFINWNWPLVDASGAFDIPSGWAEDERNWAVLMAAQNIVETATGAVAPRPAYVLDPSQAGATAVERAWHFLLAGYESGYMYYGAALDMEVKPTLAGNRAIAAAQSVMGADATPPTVWLPQRLPWNPGGFGGGALWGYPGGDGAPMSRDFHVWTFIHDVSGTARVQLMVREDADGHNDPATHHNELYAGGADVGAWTALDMTRRAMPLDEPWPLGEIDFTVLPTAIADQWWIELTGYEDVLLDYYVEAEDSLGHVTRTPIQHVYVGTGDAGGGDGPVVRHAPDPLEAGATASVWYDPAGRPLSGAASVLMHWGVDGWTQVTDTAMAWDDTASAWRANVFVPASALVLDCVFTDGAGTWDNNGGADWHLPIEGSGGEVSPFLMDGQPDAGAWEEDCGAFSIWFDWQEPWLYVATDAVTTEPGDDVFILLGGYGEESRPAPWIKSGQTWAWDAFLAAEGDHGWSGWFDAGENTPPAGRFYQTRGAVLEGAFHADDLWPVSRPLELVVSTGVYATPAAGALLAQCPAGNGDGNIDASEILAIWVPVDVTPAPRGPRLTAAPNPFNPSTTLFLAGAPDGPVELTVHDAAGRVIRRLDGRSIGGEARVVWDGRDDARRILPSGAYFVRVKGSPDVTTRVLLLK